MKFRLLKSPSTFFRMHKIIKLLSLFLILNNSSLYCASKDSISNLQKRVELIEEKEVLSDKRFDVKSGEIDLKVKQIADKLNDDYSFIKWCGIVFGSVTLLSIGLMLLRFRKVVNERMEKEVISILNDKRGKLIELIHSQDGEQKLREQEEILVISSSKVSNKFLLSFFDKFKFKKVRYYGESDNIEIPDTIDLVLFDFTMLTGGPEFANSIIAKCPKQCSFFVYTDKGPINLNEKDRTAFANAKTQLYGNLINCLKSIAS